MRRGRDTEIIERHTTHVRKQTLKPHSPRHSRPKSSSTPTQTHICRFEPVLPLDWASTLLSRASFCPTQLCLIHLSLSCKATEIQLVGRRMLAGPEDHLLPFVKAELLDRIKLGLKTHDTPGLYWNIQKLYLYTAPAMLLWFMEWKMWLSQTLTASQWAVLCRHMHIIKGALCKISGKWGPVRFNTYHTIFVW